MGGRGEGGAQDGAGERGRVFAELEPEADQVSEGAGLARQRVRALVADVRDKGGQVEDGAVGRADLEKEWKEKREGEQQVENACEREGRCP